MAELKLRLQLEGNPEKIVTVEGTEFTVGRLPECNLYIPFFDISRYHARFFKNAAGEWLIEDLGSKNGTKINERWVNSPEKIHHGDVLELGSIHLSVIFSDAVPSPPPIPMPMVEPPGMTIFRNVKALQQEWIHADIAGQTDISSAKAIARLKELVEIAKSLNYAESIEAIFYRVKEVVFRYLNSIERLALLIDVSGTGKLELLDAAARNLSEQQSLSADGSWISRTICQKVFTEKVAIQTADAQSDERFEGQQSILLKDIHSALAVPLWDEDRVVGVLYADAHRSSYDWTLAGEEDLRFFSTLANLVAASVQRWLLTRKLKNEEIIRRRLERYHSPAVVQQLMGSVNLGTGRLPPAESDISILFADIVGFTALSERLSAAEIAQLLNDLFEEMVKEVFAVGGTLDKFIGDCIMAFFGAPEPQPDHAQRALAAATGMLDRLDRLNRDRVLREPLQLRISINSGNAVVGDVGSSQRVDYTVLGATINLAARMEGICPPGECVISETTYHLLRSPQGFEPMGDYRFKGIDRPIRVYQTKRQPPMIN